MTALHHAASRKNLAAVELLLQHGASVVVQESQGLTPLHEAVLRGHTSLESGAEPTARLLLEHGADPMAKDELGRSPLALAAAAPSVALVKLFIQVENPRIDIHTTDNSGQTLLMNAAYGCVQMKEGIRNIHRMVLCKRQGPEQPKYDYFGP